jgi:hypothetical protein
LTQWIIWLKLAVAAPTCRRSRALAQPGDIRTMPSATFFGAWENSVCSFLWHARWTNEFDCMSQTCCHGLSHVLLQRSPDVA